MEENNKKTNDEKILLLEDDLMIASGIVYALETEGYNVIHCKDIVSAKKSIKENRFDLGILDMQLPDGNGFEISPELKKLGIPIIFLTIVDEESSVVKAFDEGADDYVVKPFRIRELIARVKRTISKKKGVDNEIITIGEVTIDVTAGKVFTGGRQIDLTALEYRLLLIFAMNKSKVLSRTQILEKIWDIDGDFVEDNTLTVYVKRLREKLGSAVNIETVRGIGYRVD